MKNLKLKVEALFAMFNTNELRQRIIITAAIFIGLHAAWDLFIYQPQVQRLTTIESAISQDRRAITELRNKIDQSASKSSNHDTQQIATFEQQIEQLDSQIKSASSELIAPNQMPEVLRQLLTKNTNLRVTALTTEPAEIVSKNNPGKETETPENPVYKHSMSLSFEGDYLNTLAYIHSVEKMGWRIFWDSVHIDSTDYPRTRVSISLYTLSLDEGWIGV